MTDHMTDHLTFDQLCDLADGAAEPRRVEAWRAHLDACAECAGRHAELTSLADDTARLPREIAPPPELWTAIRAGLARRESASRFSWWTPSVRRLAAAGLLVAASSSALTLLAVRARDRAPAVARSASATAPVAAPVQPAGTGLPAHLASAEQGYARSVEALRRTLDERRDSLATSTVETVERSLRIADAAIAEAREALARDPANGLLAEIFASNYERKIDLLRRATELAPRT
jgi:hypothetical protein